MPASDPDGVAPEPIELVLTDVDGTLVTSEKVLTPATVAAVDRLHDAGVRFAVTSGRPPKGMEMLIDPLSIDLPIGAFNGGVFVDAHMEIESVRTVAHHVVGDLVDFFDGSAIHPSVRPGEPDHDCH